MNKTVLASIITMFSVNLSAAECDFNNNWEMLQNFSVNGQSVAQNAESIRFDYRQRNLGGNFYAVYLSDDDGGERFLCASDAVADTRHGFMGEVSVGSYPQLSCVFSNGDGLKEFTAVLVKDGQRADQRCARDFFEQDTGSVLFGGQAQNMSDSCYSPQQCLIYWRIDALDYTINEDDGQGMGGNDGGSGPASTTEPLG